MSQPNQAPGGPGAAPGGPGAGGQPRPQGGSTKRFQQTQAQVEEVSQLLVYEPEFGKNEKPFSTSDVVISSKKGNNLNKIYTRIVYP